MALYAFNTYRVSAQVKTCQANMNMLNAATHALILRENLADSTKITIDMILPSSNGNGTEVKSFIQKMPSCPAGGDYEYDASKQSWYCTLGGDSKANGGYPHGSGKSK